MDRTELLKV